MYNCKSIDNTKPCDLNPNRVRNSVDLGVHFHRANQIHLEGKSRHVIHSFTLYNCRHVNDKSVTFEL